MARQPDQAARAAEDAVYGGAETVGWDECLPTVGRSSDPVDPDAAPLRDHGDFWGREAAISGDQSVLVTEWPAGRWGLGFMRRLRLDSSAVIAEYALFNPGPRPVPVLWSAHPVLRLEPGTRIHLPRIDLMRVEGTLGVSVGPRQVGWPRAETTGGDRLDLDVVGDPEARMSLKLFAAGLNGRAGALAPDGSWIGVAWDATFAPFLGVWLNYGAWPQDAPLHAVALEPTTSARDVLSDAVRAGQAPAVAPGRTIRWWMRLELGTEPHGLAAFLRA
jgi:hypothetical protein